MKKSKKKKNLNTNKNLIEKYYPNGKSHLEYPDNMIYEHFFETIRDHPNYIAYEYFGHEVTYQKFVKEILIDKLKVTKVVMGSNSTFGKNSKGNIDTMRKLAEKYNFEVVEVELLVENGKVMSSTNIRNERKRSLV